MFVAKPRAASIRFFQEGVGVPMNFFSFLKYEKPKVRQSGFTLIELMIVIALIAILVAVSTPGTIAWLNARGAREAADQLAMDLQRAKLLAIQRNANCIITINVPTNQYTISITNEVIDLRRYRGVVTFTDVSAPQITFTPQGIRPDAGDVFLTNQINPTQQYRLRVSAAGGISTQLI